MKIRLTRDITVTECPWLDSDLKKGEIVYDYTKVTYGCISPAGIAVSVRLNTEPFFEIPEDAAERII